MFKRWITLRWLPRWRSLLVTSKASSSATTHNIYLILLRKSKAFHRRQIRFEILSATYQKLWGRVPSTPTPLVPRWGYRLGMNLRVRLISLFLASSGAQVQPDIAHPCCDQLTAVKTEYTLISILTVSRAQVSTH